MLLKNVPALPAKEQYALFQREGKVLKSEVLNFQTPEGWDVYNPTVPFCSDGKTIIAGRTEAHDGWISHTDFYFEDADGVWQLLEDAPRLESLEDPFITVIGGELILGGVHVKWEGRTCVEFYTQFYRGTSVYNLKPFLRGPMGMKDIRLCGLRDGRVAVFTRPNGQRTEPLGMTAAIGFAIAPSLDALTTELMENAVLLQGHFLPAEWGGCNQIHELSNGLLGCIGHKSYRENGLHYYGFSFALDPDTLAMTQSKIIIERASFPKGPTKRADLADITFTSGLFRNPDGTATVYTGLNDCQVGCAHIPDPLLEYEALER